MSELTPKEASELASEVYLVQAEAQVDFFFTHQVFSQRDKTKGRPRAHLKAEVGGRLLLNTKDGFGICGSGGDSHPNDLFLVFRGTTSANNYADCLTDARIGITRNSAGLPVHLGFDHCFMSMLPAIRRFLFSFGPNFRTVHCVGHSLGGAIAALAADWIARNCHFSVKLYTFGAPRVGAGWFAQSTTSVIGASNMRRVYHRTDPVSLVPLYPFMHAPYSDTGHYIYSNEPLIGGAAHKMAKYRKSVCQRSWEQLCEVPEEPYSVESAIEAWLKSKSPVDSSSPSFWRWLNSAIIYVLKKIAISAIYLVQSTFIGVFTVTDRIAYILATGVRLGESISIWVVHLVRKLMEVLGMRPPRDKSDLSHQLIRSVLVRVTEEANRDARNAIRNL